MSLCRRGHADFLPMLEHGSDTIATMKMKLTPIPQMQPEDLTDREAMLLHLLGEREEYIQQLIDENARLKGEKGKPKIKPSRLEPKKKPQNQQQQEEADSVEKKGHQQKRPGSAKRRKTASLTIHSTEIIKPSQEIPTGSEFKGYKDYTVCDLKLEPHNILYRQERRVSPNRRVPEWQITRRGSQAGSLWTKTQKLSSLSISSLPCDSTVTLRTDERMGARHLSRATEPYFSGRQRLVPCRKERNPTSRSECIELH